MRPIKGGSNASIMMANGFFDNSPERAERGISLLDGIWGVDGLSLGIFGSHSVRRMVFGGFKVLF